MMGDRIGRRVVRELVGMTFGGNQAIFADKKIVKHGLGGFPLCFVWLVKSLVKSPSDGQ